MHRTTHSNWCADVWKLASLTNLNNLLLYTSWILTQIKIKNYYRLSTSELNPGFTGQQGKFMEKIIINRRFIIITLNYSTLQKTISTI